MDIKKIVAYISAGTIITAGVTHQVNQEEYDLISKYEGVALVPYEDIAVKGLYTVCRGVTSMSSPNFVIPGKKYSPEECMQEEIRLMEIVNKQVASVVKVNMALAQRNALEDFTWNLGIGTLKKSDLLRYINNNECIKASGEFDKYNKAGKIVYKGLVSRRNDEEANFVKWCLPDGTFPKESK